MEGRGSSGRPPRTWPCAVVAILRHNGGPLRARTILKILQETGTSFISDNPVYSVVGALKVTREDGRGRQEGEGMVAGRVAGSLESLRDPGWRRERGAERRGQRRREPGVTG